MTKRLEIIFSVLPECRVFADIGCDHGYISKMMAKSGKCEKIIYSDVSRDCLKKAERLLKAETECGKATGIVSDGFKNLPVCDCALIAGMGGEEIINILSAAENLPENLVLQPMKNCDKVRRYTAERGYRVVKDFVFKADGKFYDLIVIKKLEDALKDADKYALTEEEIEFGRDNVIFRGEDFKEKIAIEREKLKKYLSCDKISDDVRREMTEKIERLSKYV